MQRATDTTFQPRRPFHPRPPRRRRPPAAPATVDVVMVAVDHGTEFNWVVYWEFSGPIPESLAVADLAGLTVAHAPPAAVDERGDNWLMLLHHSEEGAGATWLVVAGGSPVFVPGQTGVVGEL